MSHIKHRFVSPYVDGGDTTKLRPSVWGNAQTDYTNAPVHVLDGGAHGSVLMRDTNEIEGWSWTATPLDAAHGGTGTGTAFTAGSVIFAGAAGVYSQDNANFFWDDTNNVLGLGVIPPDSQYRLIAKGIAASSMSALSLRMDPGAAPGSFNRVVGITNEAFTVEYLSVHASSTINQVNSSLTLDIRTMNASSDLVLTTNIAERVRILAASGRVGFGVAAPTAVVHLKAGTATANTAPLKFNSGTLLTAAEAGAVEFLTDAYYGTITTGAARKAFAMLGSGSAFTAGSVIFADSSGLLAQDNTNLFWDDTNNRLGIGVNASLAKALTVNSSISFIGNLSVSRGIVGTPTWDTSYVAMQNGTLTETAANSAFNQDSLGATSVNSASGQALRLKINNSAVVTVSSTLKVGIGSVTSPTASVHIQAGSVTANTAPLKFNSGSLLATAEVGAVEFLTDDFYATITTGAARKGIVLNDGTTLTSGKYPIASINGRLIDGPTPLAGIKVYFVADSSGGAVTRQLTFTNGILTSET